ncbi:tetratricopeptide repeat protein [Streptomyces sp. NPDC089915]|uniref:tetratricopeptide repeat protein n=1 Tax=Streptomyces sp. NPDC089915 TaxID=3155186 RepID=UPI00343DAC77
MSGIWENAETNNTINGGLFFHAVVQGRDITMELPSAVTPALSGLPAPASAFTGRDQHVERLLADLAPTAAGDSPQPRTVLLSAVSGLAGIGKTELAVQTAAQALERPGWFPGGVLFTDLAGYDPERRLTPERALEGLLRALAIPSAHIPNGLQDRQRLYRSVLAAYAREGRRILVIIDNASSSGQVDPLLPTDGTTVALVTSRHTLDGLDARLHDLHALDENESTAVLDQALRQARGDHDTRITDDRASATRIARLCAGLPLALRIAAATLAAAPNRPAASVAAALQVEHTRLDKLARPNRAVRAAFDLSYQLLPLDQAQLFRLLSLNPGPDLSTEATAHLADIGLDVAEVLMQHLAEAHLIEPAPVWGRWRMHDLVRLYADSLGNVHAARDQRDSARTRLFNHYGDTAEAAGIHLENFPGPGVSRFPDRIAALEWLDAEHTNLVATATVAPALGHPVISTSLAGSLSAYLDFRRYFDDWITVTSSALTVFREAGDRLGEGQALNNLGVALRKVGRFGEAIATHTRQLAICRELGDLEREGYALNNLGCVLREVGRFEESIDVHAQAAIIFREAGDAYREGQTLLNLGIALRKVGRFEQAIATHIQELAICRGLGDLHREGQALNNLGLALRGMRRFEESIDAHTQAAVSFRKSGDRWGEGQALGNLGSRLQEVGRLEEAIDAHTQAATIVRERGDHRVEGQALYNLGLALQQVRRFEEAIHAHMQAAARFRKAEDRDSERLALTYWAIAHNERWLGG